MSGLQVAWFIVLGALLAGYVILDGYDLGIGLWYLFTRKEDDRRALLRVIAPHWDANEVWLITAGAAVFAAFPMVYATVFSGLYLALMLVLFALIFRAVSIEFAPHNVSPRWNTFWSRAFGIGSALPALLFGVAMGNVLRGLPMDSSGNFAGNFFTLLNPYSLVTGLAGLALFAMHGGLFAQLTLKDDQARRAREWTHSSWDRYLLLYMSLFAWTAAAQPQITANYQLMPALWLLPALTLAGIILTGIYNDRNNPKTAFILSSISIATLFATIAAALFPNLVPAINPDGKSLTISNASSSPLTLSIMLGVTIAGMALVLVYTVWVRRSFKGGGDY